MSKMDQTQFAEACGALASAWKNISESGQVYGLMNEGGECSAQINWKTMCELFPDMRIAFVERYCDQYPWEARIDVKGVTVFALLTNAQKYVALDEEDEALNKEAE